MTVTHNALRYTPPVMRHAPPFFRHVSTRTTSQSQPGRPESGWEKKRRVNGVNTQRAGHHELHEDHHGLRGRSGGCRDRDRDVEHCGPWRGEKKRNTEEPARVQSSTDGGEQEEERSDDAGPERGCRDRRQHRSRIREPEMKRMSFQ
ncbi:hypothetical protein MHYP_G00182370 [Metynnis hypsauchen]